MNLGLPSRLFGIQGFLTVILENAQVMVTGAPSAGWTSRDVCSQIPEKKRVHPHTHLQTYLAFFRAPVLDEEPSPVFSPSPLVPSDPLGRKSHACSTLT